jgi:hypothetical protein
MYQLLLKIAALTWFVHDSVLVHPAQQFNQLLPVDVFSFAMLFLPLCISRFEVLSCHFLQNLFGLYNFICLCFPFCRRGRALCDPSRVAPLQSW